jgi:hypothetical protein
MPAPVFILTTSPFAKASIPLGSLVPDRSSPATDLLTTEGITTFDYSKVLDKNFDALISGGSDTWFEVLFSNFLSFVLRVERTAKFHVTADKGYIYLLNKPKAIFDKLFEKEDTKKWLEEGYLDKQDTWFIVGFRTFVNAKLHRERRKASEGSAKAKAPMSQVSGDPSGAANVGGSGGHKGWEEVQGDTETAGERVYAICYRKVKITFHQGQIDAKLQRGNVWKTFASTTRGSTQQADEYLEATIEDTDDVDYEKEGYSTEIDTSAEDEAVIFAIPPELQ